MSTTIINTPASNNKFENTIVWQIATNLVEQNSPLAYVDSPRLHSDRYDEITINCKGCGSDIKTEADKIKFAQETIMRAAFHQMLKMDLSSFELGEDDKGNVTVKAKLYRPKLG